MNNLAEAAERFALAGRHFCSTVDSRDTLERSEFLLEIYRSLPLLISAAMSLPTVISGDDDDDGVDKPKLRMTVEAWTILYESLKKRVDDWDSYQKVFDPTSGDTEAIFGSLADDIADIYRDVKEGIVLRDAGETWENVAFDWRLMFYSHWGHHAIDALEVIHCRLSESLM